MRGSPEEWTRRQWKTRCWISTALSLAHGDETYSGLAIRMRIAEAMQDAP
ncbi:hypothetical protein [Xanthomonas sp. NCPPB 4468]